MLVEGLLAGYGVAIPLGAIGVLLLDLSIRRGFRTGAAAALGVATADLLFAAGAAAVGTAIASVLGGHERKLQILSAIVLFVIAVYLLSKAMRPAPAAADVEAPRTLARTYLKFLGLTSLNPTTVTYFLVLIVGLDQRAADRVDKIVFVLGVFAASASWQLVLAGMGAVLHRRVPTAGRRILGVLGAAVVAGFALHLLFA